MREAKERAFQPGIFGGPKELPIELPPPMPAAPPPSARLDVTLDLEEQEDVRKVARKVAERYLRGYDDRGRGARMKWAPPPGMTHFEILLQGFGAEYAVASWTGLPWNRGVRSKADVGRNVEVRQTRYSDGMLVLKSFDHFDRLFVLAVGRFPSYRLAGWIPGSDAIEKGRQFLPGERVAFRTGGAAHASSSGGWIVPQAALRPMADLEIRRP